MLSPETIETLRVPEGATPDLAGRPTDDTLGLPGKSQTRAEMDDYVKRLAELQFNLWAEKRRSLLVILQGMDAAGKDGTVRRVLSGVNPAGVRVTAFSAPEATELAHDYLWRVHANCPARGYIGVFNRSHYEDVVTAPIIGAIDEKGAKRRIEHITAFERMLTDEGTTIVKIFLHISQGEQARRLRDRLLEPGKGWKFSESDIEARDRWDDYRSRYEKVIARSSTEDCPWYVVPADHKWSRDAVVLALLIRTLQRMDPQPPPPSPEVEHLREILELAGDGVEG